MKARGRGAIALLLAPSGPLDGLTELPDIALLAQSHTALMPLQTVPKRMERGLLVLAHVHNTLSDMCNSRGWNDIRVLECCYMGRGMTGGGFPDQLNDLPKSAPEV
jgi:hypothetical protein